MRIIFERLALIVFIISILPDIDNEPFFVVSGIISAAIYIFLGEEKE